MKFLTPLDLDAAQKSYVRSRVQANAQVIDRCEAEAIETVAAHLQRYDLPTIFKKLTEYNEEAAYVTGDKVWLLDSDTYRFFVAVASSTGETPIDNPTYWTEGDTRHDLIVMLTTCLTIYSMYSPVESGVMPENVQTKYEDAMAMLGKIAKGTISPFGLPLAIDPDTEAVKPALRGFSDPSRTATW